MRLMLLPIELWSLKKVPQVGVEPTLLSEADFKSAVSAIPPSGHKVGMPGLEPGKAESKSAVLPITPHPNAILSY